MCDYNKHLSFAEGKIRLWSFTTTDCIQGAVKFEIGEYLHASHCLLSCYV